MLLRPCRVGSLGGECGGIYRGELAGEREEGERGGDVRVYEVDDVSREVAVLRKLSRQVSSLLFGRDWRDSTGQFKSDALTSTFVPTKRVMHEEIRDRNAPFPVKSSQSMPSAMISLPSLAVGRTFCASGIERPWKRIPLVHIEWLVRKEGRGRGGAEYKHLVGIE